MSRNERVAGPTAQRCGLVHDAGGHAHVLVLGPLRQTGQLLARERQVVEILQRQCDRALESRGRGKAGPDGHVAVDVKLGATDFGACFPQRPDDAEDIRGPAARHRLARPRLEPVQVSLDDGSPAGFGALGRRDSHEAITTSGGGRLGGIGQSERQYVAVVVVGELADEVHAARSRPDPLRWPAEDAAKAVGGHLGRLHRCQLRTMGQGSASNESRSGLVTHTALTLATSAATPRRSGPRLCRDRGQLSTRASTRTDDGQTWLDPRRAAERRACCAALSWAVHQFPGRYRPPSGVSRAPLPHADHCRRAGRYRRHPQRHGHDGGAHRRRMRPPLSSSLAVVAAVFGAVFWGTTTYGATSWVVALSGGPGGQAHPATVSNLVISAVASPGGAAPRRYAAREAREASRPRFPTRQVGAA